MKDGPQIALSLQCPVTGTYCANIPEQELVELSDTDLAVRYFVPMLNHLRRNIVTNRIEAAKGSVRSMGATK